MSHAPEIITIDKGYAGQRLDTILNQLQNKHSRSYWQQQIRDGKICIDGQVIRKSGTLLKYGQQLEISPGEIKESHLIAEDIPVSIIYQDDDIAVINKAAGMPVHPGPGHHRGTLVNALLHHLQGRLSPLNMDAERPGIVHRLDKDTSGLIVIARNEKAHRHLATQFANKSAGRIYRALLWRSPGERIGRIAKPIARHPRERTRMAVHSSGKTAVTHFLVLAESPITSHVRLQLETGRTHQIRVHMQSVRAPVLGDNTYGGGKEILSQLPANERRFAQHLLASTPSLLLHAEILHLRHPRENRQLSFQAQLPQSFSQILEKIHHRYRNALITYSDFNDEIAPKNSVAGKR
jgi:23S rRNA pseudouridine1911/1915/1917 synthase